MSRRIVDAPVETWEFFTSAAINLLFVGLLALALWPLGATPLAVRVAKGLAVLWGAAALGSMTVLVAQRFLRIDEYLDFNVYLYSNLAVGVLLLVCWSAFVALSAREFAGASLWGPAPVYVAGFLSSFVGWMAVSAFYQGIFYKLINLPVVLVCYIIFALWPAAARFLYGWFFDLF